MAKKPKKAAAKKAATNVAQTNVRLFKDGNARQFYPGDVIPAGWSDDPHK